MTAAPPNQQVATVNVNGDVTVEPDETFTVGLTSPVNATITDASGLGTILNEDVLPVITGFSVPGAKVGATITILGSGFTGTTQVAFAKFSGGTVNATTFGVVDDGHITVKVPVGSTTGTVSVTTPVGTGTSGTSFLVKPVVSSFTPTSGPVGTVVTITGKSFTGATTVKFGSKSAVFTVVSDGKITATVPTGAVTATIRVTTAGGTGTSATSFTVT